MMAGDEVYPDEVTSGPIEEPETCWVIVEAEWESDHWVSILCGKPAISPHERYDLVCAEHALA